MTQAVGRYAAYAFRYISRRARFVSWVVGLWLAAVTVQCTAIERATRVAFSLDAPAALRAQIARVDMSFYAEINADAWRLRAQEQLKPGGADAWPLHRAFSRARPEDRRYALEAQAIDRDGHTLARLRAVGTFHDEDTVRLTLVFDASCQDPCDNGRTCRDGQCVDAETLTDPTSRAAQPGNAAGSDSQTAPRDDTCSAGATRCADVCGVEHGHCDPIASCLLNQGEPVCGACPPGFIGDGASVCKAVLTDLTVDGATLDPSFSPEHTDYTLKTGLIGDQWRLTPATASPVTLTLEGDSLATGAHVTARDLPAGASELTIAAQAPAHTGLRYRFQWLTQGAQRDVIKAPMPTQNAHFGHKIALEADTLVSAAVGDGSSARGINPDAPPSGGAQNSGAVHVFRRRGQRWEQEAYIKASDASAGAAFGYSLALQGDTLVVGAWKEAGSGAAYVYQRDSDGWHEQAKLVAEPREDGSNYGQSVTIQGDTLVVGCGGYDGDSSDVGAAYVYKRSAAGQAWTFERRLMPQTPMALTWFGSSVQLGGDYLVVGATGEGGTVASGAAYVFRSDTFEPIDVLRPSAATPAGFFGAQTAIAGDTIAVGSFNNNAGLTNGVVYVYMRTADGTFEQKSALQASNTSGGDQFGRSVALSSDYLLVGAAHESSGARGINADLSPAPVNESGAAYLFARVNQSFTQVAHIKANDPGNSAELGYDVALSGADIAVSADNDAHAATGSGAVYIFR